MLYMMINGMMWHSVGCEVHSLVCSLVNGNAVLCGVLSSTLDQSMPDRMHVYMQTSTDSSPQPPFSRLRSRTWRMSLKGPWYRKYLHGNWLR